MRKLMALNLGKFNSCLLRSDHASTTASVVQPDHCGHLLASETRSPGGLKPGTPTSAAPAGGRSPMVAPRTPTAAQVPGRRPCSSPVLPVPGSQAGGPEKAGSVPAVPLLPGRWHRCRPTAASQRDSRATELLQWYVPRPEVCPYPSALSSPAHLRCLFPQLPIFMRSCSPDLIQ